MKVEKNYKIDVIIPTYKPDEKVVVLLQRLLKQTYPINEIHIVDTETSIFPEKIYSLSEKIKVTKVTKAEFDHGGTRAKAADMSNAEILVFMTQDAMPLDAHVLEELLLPFENDKVAAAYARQVADDSCGVIEQYTRKFNYPSEGQVKSYEDVARLGIKAYFCSNVCAAYRKNVYDEIGGFVKKTIFNEDSIMAASMLKAGYSVAYAADAKIMHCHNYNCIQQFKRNFDLAVSQADHPEIFRDVKSESEGIRFVKDTAKYLCKKGKPWLVCLLFLNSGCKYMGYLAGKNYQKLPKWMILKFTSNKEYWKR